MEKDRVLLAVLLAGYTIAIGLVVVVLIVLSGTTLSGVGWMAVSLVCAGIAYMLAEWTLSDDDPD